MALNIRWKFQRKLNFVFLLFVWNISSTYGQGFFPKLVDLAELKPITSTSTCGATSSKYCESSIRQTSLQTCTEQTCKFDCCANCGSSKPVPSDLAQFSNKIRVAQDGDPRNGSNVRSFRFQGNSYIEPLRVPAINYVTKGFTINVWIKQKKGNKGTIFSKDESIPPDYANVFQLVIQDYNLMFYYQPTTGNASVTSYTLLQSQSEKLQADEWHLITVAVINKGLSYYIDGELMNANVATLTGPISDSGGGVRIGQKYGGDAEWQYEGLMQDIFMYDRALTNREAIEAFTGVLPFAYVASSCRCPPTHPKINVAQPAKCLKNKDGDVDTVSRLADTAHPIEFATDADPQSFWLSEITNSVTIDINLSYSGLQIFYIVLTFYGPVPRGLEILRSTDNGKTFRPWQYFAEDCVSSFSLQNNGPLTEPDSVNCVQYVKPLQSSREGVTFQTEYPPPPGSNIPVRPFGQGCSNLYCSQSLLQFLKATHVKFRFHNHTLVQNPQHKYYGLERILVTGRCECFGHASSISYVEGNVTHPGHCVCDCHSSTNTEGETCNRCKPLYNNKPFQRGDQDDSYPCVKCECNEHADSCVYNQSLDTSPNSRTQGGGGMCIDCQHNTTGRFCEVCKERFYREPGKSLKTPDVCSPCGCEGPGVQSGKLDCVKDDSDSNVLAGQCECKAHTQGRQCDVCEDGYFDLKASRATGCVACGCVLDGSKNRNISCHATTGQCNCKDRVTGTKCDTCKSGYWGLSGVEPLGCKTCDCDPFGTTAGNVNTCNSVSGQCSCKPGSIGRKCDQCEDGFHSLTQNGCTSCNCSAAGTLPSLLDKCNKNTGRCDCKLYVEGNNCDQCKQGFYNLSQSNPQGCAQCACDNKGTEGGSGQCDQQSGNCTCKPLVVGQRCNQCKLGTFGLNQSNPDGCQPCNCFPKGTRDGDTEKADDLQCSSNGQCFCLASVSGLRCDSCIAEYYWNPAGQGCVQCQCNIAGSVARNCNDTGQCTCKANIAGRQCDRCIDGYYGFITTGSCSPCNCNAAGSLTNKCNERGECQCKDNVEGDKCDRCKNGTVNLQQNNKYGCSGAPSEQPAPFVTVLSSRDIMLTWSPPDNPNGIILRFELYRNGSLVYSGLNLTYNDSSLTPDTVYRYFIITHTESGQTRSLDDGKVYRTFQDAPDGISAPVITDILPRNVTASWQTPSMANGRITEYRLISTNSRNAAEVVNCRGIIFTCKISDLRPYTEYNFTVEACTNGGCARSNATTILTLPTLPDFQPAPNVTSLPGGRDVTVEWDEPPEPNGRILRYELYMRAAPFTSGGVLKFNSNPAHDSDRFNFRKTNVTGLMPFTEYEFMVRTYTAQVRGDRASQWTRHRTGEGTPLGENAMNVAASPFNSSSVMVSWSPPQTPQGVITSYIVYKYQPPSSPTAVRASEVNGSQRQEVVAELTPYTEYKFTVKACNSFACSGHSPEALAQTLAAAPEGQGEPTVLSVDSSTVYLKWSEPQTPNGPLPPSYNLSRAYSALYFPPPLVTAGVHFPGLGYYKFPSDFVRPGASNDIQFWFRTQYATGLLLFLVSDGSQTDMLAVELRDGKPWLIFDCQDGPAALTISQSVRFDDGEWHQLKIKRVSRRGTLTVDGYQASQDSPGTATVISSNTGVYIGGLPSTFTLLRKDTGNAFLNRISFIGCLRGITSDSRQLDWTSALEAVSVEPQRNGCPARDKKKAVLLRGGGYVAVDSRKADMLTSNIFSLTLMFRTQLSSGLLLFAYGPTTTFAIQFAQNQVEVLYVTSNVQDSVTVAPSSGEICDGGWHNVTVTNFLGNLNVILDTNTPVGGLGITNLVIQDILYIGGVPWGSAAETVAQQAGVNVQSSFGGCMMVQSTAKDIDYPKVVTNMHNANLDGCLPESTVVASSQVGKCFSLNSSVVYSGKTEMFNDSSVEVFTDYLYRVDSYHVGTTGSAKSVWIASRSGQGAPTGLQAPAQLIPLPGGKTVRVIWTPPERPNGVISEYRILSYRVHPPQSTPDESVITDISVLNATITALQPYTTYEIRIQAFTVGGSAVGPGKNVTTEESVPDSVPGVTAVRRPRELEVHWTEPGQPNGIITRYNLTLDGKVVYSGTSNNFTIQGLLAFTEYALQITACTRIGCGQGPVVRIRTGELPPDGVKAPNVFVRGRTEVEVEWEPPSILNGTIVRYEILFATSDILSAYVSKFNATPNVLRAVIGNLTAGTLYYVRVRPFTGGGGTFSNATQVTTHEDVPDDIPAPIVVADSPYALSVIMLPPDKPNGIITRYELYQDSITDPVLNVTQLTNYTARGLTPYSRHTFRVRACTAQGCAYGAQAVAFTQEIAPNGTVTLTTSIRNATAVNARWTRVAVPNGRLFYNLMVYGRFIVQSSVEFETEQRVVTAISVKEYEKDFIYNGLLPYSTYTFWVNASNTVGFVLSNNVTDSTPEGVPDGLNAPNVTVLSSTSVHVMWEQPALPNGIVFGYGLIQKTGGAETLLFNGMGFSFTVTNLQPFTVYEFRVNASTIAGSGFSEWTEVTTLEDVPSSPDPPLFRNVTSTSVTVVWDPPAEPNGVLLRYIIYQNGTEINTVMGNVTSYVASGLQPFSVYVFKLGVCTKRGCSNSSDSAPQRTLESGPRGLSAPRLSSTSGRTVVIEWDPPTIPNGILQKYLIQRRVVGSDNPSDVAEVNASLSRRYVDNTARPITAYQYRVIAYNSGPGEPSPYSNVTTGQGDPEGIATPTVRALSPYALHVAWTRPSTPNGVVTHYIIRVNDQLTSRNTTVNANAPFEFNVTSLDPYILYNVIVSACTIGGCGSSSPAQVRTLPATPELQPAPVAEAESQTSLRVRWDAPIRPNGVILRYELYRSTVEDLVQNNITRPTEFVEVFQGTPLVTEYLDTGLGIFSLHRYKVTVFTGQGNTTSNSSLPYRTSPAPPLAGATVNGTALNHTSVMLTWFPPGIQKLRGTVASYILEIEDTSAPSSPVSRVGTYPGNLTQATVTNLKANTVYKFYVELDNEAGRFKSDGFQIRTLDGMPEGFAPPALYTLSSTEIRVSWNPPAEPNGVVILYKIYVNDTLWTNATGVERQAVASGLEPFTYYVIKVAVCTTHGCTMSDPTSGTTHPTAPTGLAKPNLTPGSTFIFVQWEPPSHPNGIMSGYQIFRRMVYQCPTSPPPKAKCTFIECHLSEQLCGVTCYNPANQMCCNGVLYARDASKTCCGTSYLRKNQASDVCCGNTFHIQQADYQCCYGDYIQVSSDRVCCPKSQGGTVVGLGNACCGDTPYDKNDPSKVCVCGALYDPVPPRKCCGGKVVAAAQVCCGDENNGAEYDLERSKSCCGTRYVPSDTSLCCKGSAGDVVVYNYSTAADKTSSNHKCCGKSRVSSGLSCCNERGYNSSYQTCADMSSNGTQDCGMGTICNKTDARVAMCDRCDFDNTTLNCGFVAGYYAPTPSTIVPQKCTTDYEEILRDRYNPNLREYNDTNLTPHTVYEYYIVAINTEGNVSSPQAQNRTLMGRPEGLQSPVAVPISSTEVRVTWSKPSKPNGVIQEYRLTRINGQTAQRRVVYTGLNMTFTDRGLEPFTGYRYVIEACTTHCSSAEMTSLIYTDQAAPGYVNPAILLPVNFSAINVSWVEPPKPNGQIIRYNISRVINGTFKIHLNPNDKGLSMSLVIGGLTPFTNYTFEVVACTRVGCTASSLASTLTLQAPPEGVHPPNLTITGAREIEATWVEPDVLNGVIVKYSLYRGNLLVYNGTDVCYKNKDGKDTCIFQDKDNGLQPVTTYSYSVAATTGGGTTNSSVSTATTPESSPEAIPKPRLTVKSAYIILAEWSEPGQTNGNITSYSVIVNGTEYNVGLSMTKSIAGLNPFTVYSVRVKACTAKGCGLGDREYATTNEAAPIGQGSPTLVPQEWNVVQISWSPPSTPNGVITRYEVYRNRSGAPLLVCFTSKLTCLNTGLLGYTEYSYRVRVRNSAGSVDGPLKNVRTPEGPPQGVNPPSLNVLNSTAVNVSWTAPSQPNGVVTHYEVRYREELQVPDNNNITVAARVTSSVFAVTVHGLKPHTDYQFLIAAINSRREGTSAWAAAKTKQAPPADIRPLQADKAADGKSIRLFWDEPGNPNGVITHYKLYKDGVQLYRGATREYTVTKLVPFTAYEFQLEACTVAGCTRGSVQIIFSAEVSPQGQAPPISGFVNATVVQFSWKPPAVPNGVIIRYEVYRTVTPVQKRRKRAVTPSSGSLVHTVNDTNKSNFMYTDTGLKPYTRYGYIVRAINNGGFTDSDMLIVTTDQAAPTFIDAPLVTVIDAYSVNVTWKEPSEPNGVIQFYFVYRNESIKYEGNGNEMTFVDQGLDAYTVYSYTVKACTSGVLCTLSSPTSRRTAQAAPSGVRPPGLEAVSSVAIRASWGVPDKPNGIITRYQLYEVGNNSPLYTGLGVSLTISNKEPYTKYSFYVVACTNAGCTQSAAAEVRTKEALPMGLDAPRATVGGSSLVRVEWNSPRKPNGLILYYLLTRNGSQIYNGTDLRFDDHTVASYTIYAYVVTAVNSVDRVTSPPGFSPPTNPGVPDNVSSPTLEVLSATSMKVSWAVPGIPNGVISKYEVRYNFEGAQGNPQVKDAGVSRETTLIELLPYTLYEVRIRACTIQGCSTGEAQSARTFEAPPEGQNSPDFPRLDIGARRVLILWREPLKPNGFMLFYRLYRRGASLYGNQAIVYGPEISVVNVTNGSALAYNDTDVKPYYKYEYRVIAGNSAGETASDWSVVQTLSAPPEQLKAPYINRTYPNSFDVFILEPGTPNGEIRNYILEVSGRNESEGLLTTREVLGLEPFTEYVLRVHVCTDGGCATGPSVTRKTSVGVPSEFPPPSPVEINATTVTLEWTEPSKPNGVIQRYEVLYHKSCDVCPTSVPVNVSDAGLSRRYIVRDLSPYTMYSFKIRVYNALSSGLSGEQRVLTKATIPRITGEKPQVNVSGFSVAVDWSKCFILSGPLDNYEVLENGLLVYEGLQNKRDLGTRNIGSYTYLVKAFTLVDGRRLTAKAPLSDLVTLPIGEGAPPGTQAPRTASEEWYRSVWFIAVMALIAIFILFVLLAFCLYRSSGSRTVYVRDREPLPPRTKLRSRPPSMSSLYTSSDRKNGSVIDMHTMQNPYHSSTTALYDSTERLHRATNQYELYNGSLHKDPLDDPQDWDGFMKSHSNRDSGLYDDDSPDSEQSTPYQSFKREQYFKDTHL